MNRRYTGPLVLAIIGVALAVVWYATRHDGPDAPDAPGVALEPVPPAESSEPAQRPERHKPARAVAAFPGEGYEIAQVKEGEEVQVLAEPGGKRIATIGDESEMFGSPRVFSVVKPRPHWLGVIAAELGDGTIGWIRYDPEKLLLGDTRISVRVDLSESTLTLLREDDVLSESTITVGRAGTETPTGRYAITDTITKNLNPVYGAGAVVTSARQQRLPGGWQGGNMIAMHGWNGPVGGAESGGCLRMENADVLDLIGSVPLGAPVFISA